MDRRNVTAEDGPLHSGPEARPALDVRLLGSVRATTNDGQPINVGGPMPRLALVQLALRAGEVVSAERLIDVMWGETPPPTARRSMQAHVAKLRAALGADSGPLSSSGRGYVLRISRGEVDVLRIEDRLLSARELMATDPTRAKVLINSCRADWSGTPFDDLAAHETLNAERGRLMRLLDELNDAEAELRVAIGDTAMTVPQLERAVVDDPTHEPHWARLIKAYYASGRQRDALDAYRRATETMLDELGLDPSPQLQQLEFEILKQEIAVVDGRSACPYKGLASYQIADGASFFGRSDSIDEIIRLVMSTPIGVVVGPSGVGKSSILRAGLAHRILTGHVPGMVTVAVMTPGLQPLRSLFAGTEAVDVIVVDQFEELFTLTEDPRRREEFVDELLAVAGANGSHVVVSVRADFYGHCLSLSGLRRVMGRHQVNIGALTEVGLREAIEGPAAAAGLETEPALVDALIEEVTDQPGALPLLSHALSETWRLRSGAQLTLAGYRDAGSIAGAISVTAERLFDGLDDIGRRQLERLFLRLVEPGSGTLHTRRAADRADLGSAGFDAGLVDRLVEARLLTATTERVEIAHEALITAWPRLSEWIDGQRGNLVAQQRLARAASAWIASDRDDADLYRGNRLSAVLAWRADWSPALAETEDEFLRVSEEQAQRELTKHRRTNRRLRILTGVSVVAMVSALLASVVAVGHSRDSDQRREQVEFNQLASIVAADESLVQTSRLRTAAALQDRVSTPETDSVLFDAILTSPGVGSFTDLEILAVTGDAPVRASGNMLLAADNNVRAVVVDGATLDVSDAIVEFTPELIRRSGDQLLAVHPTTFEVIDLAGAGALGPPPPLDGEPSAVALSDGGVLVAIGYDADNELSARIDIFDVIEGTRIRTLELDAGTVDEIEFDSTPVLTATRTEGATGASTTAVELEASALQLIVTVDDRALELWDVADRHRVLRTNVDPGLTALITTSAFAAAAPAFVLGRRDGTVEIWREADGGWGLAATRTVHDAAVSWAEFGDDDTLVVSSSFDGSAVILDAVDGSSVVGPVEFDAAGALTSYFDLESGSEVVSIDSEGTAWRWSPRLVGGLVDSLSVTSGAAVPSDGQMWYGNADGTVATVTGRSVSDRGPDDAVLDVVNGRSGNFAVVYADRLEWRRGDDVIAKIEGYDVERLRGRIAVTDDLIAVVGEGPDDRQAILVMDAAGQTIEDIGVHESRADVTRVDLNESGTALVYSTGDGELVWYSLAGFDAAELLPETEGYGGHFVGSDRVVAVGVDGVRLIDTGSGEEIPLAAFGRGATQVAFAADLGLAATVGPTGEVSVWDIASGGRIGTPFAALEEQIPRWIAFDAGGALVVGGASQSAVLPLDADKWREHACSLLQSADPGGTVPPGLVPEGPEPCP